jgi:hypothetical protein
MDDTAHGRLLGILDAMTGKVAVSGYSSPLYDRFLEGWSRRAKPTRGHSYIRGADPTRGEVLWMSY